ncbi:MAG TPA: Crp/Fnr family transcriptional regulator, partial [Mycobacterium sp.]|nr:Crp/Fnr family transcriptional regulator [Mycobacterium sp.]
MDSGVCNRTPSVVLSRLGLADAVGPRLSAPPHSAWQLMYFPARHSIYDEGAPPDRLYILVSGSVKLRTATADERVLLTVVGPSEMFGAVSLIDHLPRMASATTITAVCALAIGEDGLRLILADRPALAARFMQMLARRVKRADDEIADLAFADGPGRI